MTKLYATSCGIKNWCNLVTRLVQPCKLQNRKSTFEFDSVVIAIIVEVKIINPTSKIDQSPSKMSGVENSKIFYKNNFIYRTKLVALLIDSVTFLTDN